ncbi:MAG: RNA methyltransferase [Bacteroidales bacterium]|nr:RNA methyltransferase [Bacteroidales bacterium]
MNDNFSYGKKIKLINFLKEFITHERNTRFEDIIKERTKYLTIVLEDIYQPHNASAVLRSCDCYGIQDVHIIENNNVYDVNPQVALGSSNWLHLHKYKGKDFNTPDCITHLKSLGYTIAATTPHKNGYDIADVPLNNKIALMFGTEKDGLSQYAIQNADIYVKVPMFGFTESLNISVTAAICFYQLSQNLRASDIDWKLTEEEKTDTLLSWYKNSIRDAKGLIEKFNRDYHD